MKKTQNNLRTQLLRFSVILVLWASFLIGCEEPPGRPIRPINSNEHSDSQHLTGYANEDGIPYVKDPLIVFDQEEIKDQSDNKSNDGKLKTESLDLALNIKKIAIYRLAQKLLKTDKVAALKKQATDFGSESAWIQIERINEVNKQIEFLNFEINKFEKRGQTLYFDKVFAHENIEYCLSGEISDSEKKDSYIGKYQLAVQKKSKANLVVKFYQRFYFANIQRHAAKNDVSEKLLAGTLYAAVTNWTFINGPAFRNVKIFDQAKRELVTEFDAPSIRTEGLSPNGYPLVSAKDSVSLLGLDESSGDQLYVITDKGQNVYLELTNVSSLDVSHDTVSGEQASDKDSIQKQNADDLPKVSDAALFQQKLLISDVVFQRAVAHLNNNWQIQKVKDLVLYWSRQTEQKPYKAILGRNSIANYFKNISPLKDELAQIFSSYGVPPQMSFTTLVENNFFTSNDYSYVEVNKKSTASGIYQLLKNTAKRFGLMVDSDQREGERPNSLDERLYFYPASCSVAKMMSYYINIFKNDATLAFLAYRLGEGRAASILECTRTSDGKSNCGRKSCSAKTCSGYLKNIKDANMKYTHLAKYNVLPAEIAIWMNQILAAYFIAQDLQAYGYASKENHVGPVEKILLPPNGNISDPKCRQIVADFK